MISEKAKEGYFCARDWTGQISLKRLPKMTVGRKLCRFQSAAQTALTAIGKKLG
ncbi:MULTISPECIES: hypothetical protein [unclassified Bradyrhizobium]|uniref:hypothetical protein n=1 Tax=unclassified Bradyrhizobium TaxID=2631580 RepID=UPI0028EBFD3A|nr:MULTISPECIES: hypothetical protein [unclassified Bradyrhizobium]